MNNDRQWAAGSLQRKERQRYPNLFFALVNRAASMLASLLPAFDLRPPTILILLLCFATSGVEGAEQDRRWAILLVGLSGDPDLQKNYLKEIVDLRAVLGDSLGFPRDQIVVLFDDPSKGQGIVQYQSTRENLQAVCRDLAGRVRPDDLVFVFIEGHGSYEGKNYKLQLVGPDPTAEEIASMLYSIPTKRFVIVNATNCSGGSIPALSRQGTVVITATKSGMEKNYAHLGRYIIDAFQNRTADSDKNGRVSMIEAFSYARQKVEKYYETDGSLPTEHPVLEDTGDGQAQSNPAPENGEGLLARNLFLDDRIATETNAKLTPEQEKLAREARDLEMKIEALKYAKSEMPEADFEKQLEDLLLRLAQINAKLPKER